MTERSGEIGQVRLQGWFDPARWTWTVRVLVNGAQVGDLRVNDGQYEVLLAAFSDSRAAHDGRCEVEGCRICSAVFGPDAEAKHSGRSES